ncbi:MAG: homocysteine S-methyltransferase family protein [Desulfotomaculaceae bacterium]
MKREYLNELLDNRLVILDGGTGTELQKRGMPQGECPEQWVIEHPNVLAEIQNEYIEAGSDILCTCTFGGNRVKLEEYGLGERVVEINRELARISKKAAAGSNCFVAGDLAPTGNFIEPFGDMPFEKAVAVYKEQVQGLLEGGVDLFIIETMLDIQEARAALLAVKETSDLPVLASMTFGNDGRTLTNSDPVTVLLILQSLGADAVGVNCSTGPRDMIEIISLMKPYARVPLLAKPNAGLPRLINGVTKFEMEAEEYGAYAKDFVRAGVNLLGGCCGTSPPYIESIKRNIEGCKPTGKCAKPYSALTSSRKTVFVGFNSPVAIIGERINPTGKKQLGEELKQGKFSEVRRLASEQVENGAELLDVNVGMPGIDEKETMVEVVKLLSNIVETPLCLDSSSPEVLEAALRIYPGKALINSISAEKTKLEKLLPLAKKYGAMFILLPLNDEGVPEEAEKRCSIIKYILDSAAEYGIGQNDAIVDGLVMTVSSNQHAALETLQVIEWCTKLGCATTIGLSNVSFGLPQRDFINTAFLAMAVEKGLCTVIANPSSEMLINIKMACDVLTLRDKNSLKYIGRFTGNNTVQPKRDERKNPLKPVEKIYNCVLVGDKEEVVSFLKEAINEGVKPKDIVDIYLIPAITKVGELYDEKKYFLPQLIQSAETVKTAFDYLQPYISQDKTGSVKTSVSIVLATVKGDIHDIGKNIVGLMLRNYGFDVIDLGKDVRAEDIIAKGKETGASIIGLSALMTTTMVEMKNIIQLAKDKGLNFKFMIGGAVVNDKYAVEIGADGYAKDAYEAVKLAKKLSFSK